MTQTMGDYGEGLGGRRYDGLEMLAIGSEALAGLVERMGIDPVDKPEWIERFVEEFERRIAAPHEGTAYIAKALEPACGSPSPEEEPDRSFERPAACRDLEDGILVD